MAYSAPSHYLNQRWLFANWDIVNKFQWILSRNSYIFIQENAFENIVCEKAAILSRGDELEGQRTGGLFIGGFTPSAVTFAREVWQYQAVSIKNKMESQHVVIIFCDISLKEIDEEKWFWNMSI